MLDVPFGVLLMIVVAACGQPGPVMSPTTTPPTPAAKPSPSPRSPITLAPGASRDLGELRLELVDIVIEEIAEAPGAPEAYPAGSGVTVTVELGGERASLTRLSPGYTSQAVAWLADHRVELVEAAPRSAQLLVDRVTDRVAATQPIRIRVGERVRLHDRVDFAFQSHGHKMVEEGTESPLLVRVTFDGDDAQFALFPPRQTTFQWQDLRFRLGAYAYGDFMELAVERLALEPVTP